MLAKTIGIAAVAAALSGLATYTLLNDRLQPIEDRMAHTPPIMVLDVSKLVGQWVQSEDSQQVLTQMEGVQQSIDKLTDAGYLILRAEAVAGAAKGLELSDLLPLKTQDDDTSQSK